MAQTKRKGQNKQTIHQEELKKAPTSLLLPQQKNETMLRKGYKRIQDIMDDDTSDPFHPNYKPFKKLKKATGPLGLCESKFQLCATALPNRTVLPQFVTKKNTKRQIHETFEMYHGNLIPGHDYLQPKKVTLKLSPTKPEKSVRKNNFPVTPKISRSRKHPIQHNTVNKERTPTNQEIKMRQMEQAIIDSKGKLKGLQKNTHYCIPNRMQFTLKQQSLTLKQNQHGQTYKALASSLPLSRHQHHPMWDTLSPQPNWPKTPTHSQHPALPKSLFDIRYKIMHNRLIIGIKIRHIPNMNPERQNARFATWTTQSDINSWNAHGPNSMHIPSKGTVNSKRSAQNTPNDVKR